ncbi:tetratricopeptide repeat protein [Poriferisphaera corsica]|uniref:Tetratricopeptide repeat protein n=1 Tax=Poriferisphaera corsica TaxID=2528020 RepID=A0A517YS79_9BACT|nr:tetratricopeptide repeat protein [Poriferisphaera corsica]QDU33072.1 tetratricopeptide repeat protein [Poriferisphaera corsica]
MALHATAKKRIVILLTVIVIIGVTISGLWFYRQDQNEERVSNLYAQANQLYDAGDYRKALEPMSKYVRNEPTDLDATYKLVEIYENVPQPGGRNIAAAVGKLQQIVDQNFDYKDATERLLDYYVQFQQNDEANQIINQLLAADPQNIDALEAQAVIDSRLRRFKESLNSADQVLALDPDNFRMQLLRIEVQNQLDVPVDKLIEEAENLAAAKPDDARYNLILSYVYQLAQDSSKSLSNLQKAAAYETSDTDYINTLIQFLDASGLFSQSISVLQNAAARTDDPLIHEALIVRLMEVSRYNDALDVIGEINPESPATNLRILMYQTIALTYTDQEEQADKNVNALIKRSNDPQSETLGIALKDVLIEQDASSSETAEKIETAIKHHPSYAYLYLFLGEEYNNSNELEMAIDVWQNAARLRPSWAQPLAQLSLVYLAQGKTVEAQALATAAAQRDQSNPSIAATWALATAANIKPDQKDQATDVLNVIKQLENRGVQGNQLLLMQLTLLEKINDKDQAKQVILDALDNDNEINQQTLLSIANLSRGMNLGLSNRIYDKVQNDFGMNPQLALARSIAMMSEGNVNEANQYFKDQYQQNINDEEKLNWDIAQATFWRINNDPRYIESWEAIANNYPDSARAQQLAIRALSGEADALQSVEKTLERLEQLTGADNINVRIERARILLNANNTDRNPEEAIKILESVINDFPDRIEPRLMIAKAYEESGNVPIAMRELANISKNNPDNPRVAIELARMYQSIRSFNSSSNQLDIVRQSPLSTGNQLSTAARLYAGQNENRLALSIIEKLKNDNQLTENDLLLAAELYRRTDQNGKLQPLLANFLTNPTPRKLAWSADYYASIGENNKANQLIAQIKNLNLGDGVAEQYLANYAAAHQDLDKALNFDIQRTEKQPNNPNAWRQLIARYVIRGDGNDAVAAATTAMQHIDNDLSLKAFINNQNAIIKFSEQPIYRPIILGVLGDAENRTISSKILNELTIADKQDLKASDFADLIKPIANKHPGVLAPQNLIAEIYLRTGKFDEALQIADRVAVNFPDSPSAVRIATDAHMALGEWNDAIISANQWISRSSDAKLEASTRIAAAQIQLNQAYNAIRTLNPYVEQAQQQPDIFPQILTLYGQALAKDNRIQQAVEFYQPLFEKAPEWRAIALRSAILPTRNPNAIAAWLKQIESSIPVDDLDQQALLAESLWDVGNRFDMDESKQQAISLIDNIVSKPEAPATAWFIRGVIHESNGQLNDAAISYREAIKINPDLASAKNNLAFILIQQSQANKEAASLAEEAVNASPANPSFLDTLAAVQSANKDYKKAIETQKKAITLEPNNPLWRVNLLRIYENAGMEHDANELKSELQNRGIQLPNQPTTQK